jgi:drug/metabolite transporter (DMT)-like permease
LTLSQSALVNSLEVSLPRFSKVESSGPNVPLKAWVYTIIGVICFSGTFPATRMALTSFDALTVAFVRGAGAGLIAALFLWFDQGPRPSRSQLVRLLGASLGMVVAFPIAISTALKFVPATHASVVAAILPLSTALFGVLRGRERAPVGFWVAAIFGTLLIALFCGYRSGFTGISLADIWLLFGFVCCSYGYAEGGLLARELGGWKVICWLLLLMLPFETSALIFQLARCGFYLHPPTPMAWTGLIYATAISQLIGFYFYYKGLALGGIARMSQVQLFLPFAAIYVAHWVLGEPIDLSVLLGAAAMTMVVVAGKGALGGGRVSQRKDGAAH